MRRAILTDIVTGRKVRVHATRTHYTCSYGQAVWVDDDDNAYCQVGIPTPFFIIEPL